MLSPGWDWDTAATDRDKPLYGAFQLGHVGQFHRRATAAGAILVSSPKGVLKDPSADAPFHEFLFTDATQHSATFAKLDASHALCVPANYGRLFQSSAILTPETCSKVSHSENEIRAPLIM